MINAQVDALSTAEGELQPLKPRQFFPAGLVPLASGG
jgi:hypothetical protein